MFSLKIKTGNAAFEDSPATEIARILRELACDLLMSNCDHAGSLRDYNGNIVGEFKLTNRG